MGVLVSFALTLAPVRRQIRLSFDLEAFWKSFGASMGMIIVVCLAQYVSYNRLLLPGYVALGTCLYVGGLGLLKAIHKADVQLAEEFLRKRYEPPVNLFHRSQPLLSTHHEFSESCALGFT